MTFYNLNNLKNSRSPMYTKAVVACLIFIILVFPTVSGLAQSPGEDPWSPPVNVSYSGVAVDPVVVEDAWGTIHVVWQEAFDPAEQLLDHESGYSSFDGSAWSAPETEAFHFSPNPPQLISDGQYWVHAFWIDEDGALFSSRVPGISFGNPLSWETPRKLSSSVLAVDVVLDSNRYLHVVYMTSLEEAGSPPGVYYVRSTDNGRFFPNPIALYLSPYFQSVQAEDANLDIVYGEHEDGSGLYAVWDNRSRKEVMFSRSGNNGSSWTSPALISGPTPGLGNRLPFNIQASAQGEEVLLLWQIGEPGESCVQYYQNSTDSGENWSKPLTMLGDIAACPEGNQLLTSGSSFTILMTFLFDRPYMLAWNGSRWSEPQLQDTLSAFEDSEVFDQVTLDCHYLERVSGNRIISVGCDSDEGGDIWVTSRSLGSDQAWFSSSPSWSIPFELQTSMQLINMPSLLIDEEGRTHVAWTQEIETVGGFTNQVLYFASGTGDRWSQPVEHFGSQLESSHQPLLEQGFGNRIYLSWIGRESGSIYYSWVDSGLARYQGEWAPAQIAPTVSYGIGGFDFLEIADGNLLFAYSLPFNDERGIYLTLMNQSQGESPGLIKAFNGRSKGWAMVGPPHLAETDDGTLHMLWSDQPLPDRKGLERLYYSRSVDGGWTWSEELLVAETEALSSWLVSWGDQIVHLLFLELRNDRPRLNHHISFDSGQTWIPQDTFSIFGDLEGPPTLTVDPSGQIHFMQVIENLSNRIELRHWQWNGVRWISTDSMKLEGYQDVSITHLIATSEEGVLGVAIAGEGQVTYGNEWENILFLSNRSVDPIEIILVQQSDPSEMVVSTLTPTDTTATTPTQPAVEPVIPVSQAPPVRVDRWTGLILGGGLGLLFVVAVAALRYLFMRGLFRTFFINRVQPGINRFRNRIKRN